MERRRELSPSYSSSPARSKSGEKPREGGVHGGFFVSAANAGEFFEFILGYGLAAVDQGFGDGGGKFPRTSRSMGSKVVVYLGARMRAFLRFQACTVVPYYIDYPACCMVAQRPAVWSFFTSPSTLSFSPVLTTAFPSVCTCIMSSWARFLS